MQNIQNLINWIWGFEAKGFGETEFDEIDDDEAERRAQDLQEVIIKEKNL